MAEENWLIVGLGNPGDRYERTRHNLGFMLIDRLAEELAVQVKRDECRSLVGQTGLEGETVELVKPQTYMNLSGEAVSCLLRKENRSAQRMVVVVDDLALPFGTIRLRPKGSHGGHNGLRSVIDCLRTQDFIRLRIGIQPEHPVGNTKNFVLQRFSGAESESVGEIVGRSADAVRTVVAEGVEKAMSRHNG